MLSLNVLLLGNGILTTLALASGGMFMYFSGSAHYVAGAQALVLLPVAAASMFRSRWQLLSGILLASGLFMALMSGARAVYLPLVLICVLSVWRLWRKGIPIRQMVLGFGAIGLLLITIDLALPFSPVQHAIGIKVRVAQQSQDTAPEGSLGSRLLMWDQTLSIAFKEPLGTGNGSFRDVLAAYQKYPSVLFANAHNYYLETAATGGWPRLIALLWLLGWILWQGWRSSAWTWALGSAALWITLAFDITGMYPAVMMLAFASLGTVYGQFQTKPQKSPVICLIPVLLGSALTLWWFLPCRSECTTTRHLGYRPEVQRLAPTLPQGQLETFLERVVELNPKSLWAYRTRLRYAQTSVEQLEILRSINARFPLAGPWFYLQQAELATQLGLQDEAIAALHTGLNHFPTDFRPAGIPLGDSIYKQYEAWSLKAPSMLKQLETQ
jgi:hypothetical protein